MVPDQRYHIRKLRMRTLSFERMNGTEPCRMNGTIWKNRACEMALSCKGTVFRERKFLMYSLGKWGWCEWINLCFPSFFLAFFLEVTRTCFHEISCKWKSVWHTDVYEYLLKSCCTTEYIHFVGTPIDGVATPLGENEHQFWDNLCG